MQQRRVKLPEMPEFGEGDILFNLKDIAYTPETPRLKQPFTVKGKIELFKIPFLAPIWVRAKVTYPEAWWEEIVPIIGAPTVIEGDIAIGSDFEISFPRGFDREGEFVLEVEAYAGPTFSVAKMTIPPFPPVTSYQTTFLVTGEVPEEELGFRNFRILSYSKNGGPPVTPPGVLELEAGDRCRVNVGFDHMDGAVTGMFHAAIWKKTLIDPHDEQLNADKAVTAPSSTDWEPREGYIDIIITSAISPGSEYGLYVKIMGITGGDIFTEYLENVITIIGPPPEADIADFGFQLTKGTYDIGAKVPFTAGYKYKGKTQGGQLTISIGTGVTPSFFTKYTYDPVPVEFLEAADWEERGLEGSITLPDVLEAGQTYSVRAKLETLEVKAQEIDTDWSAFDVTEMETLEVRIDPVGAGYVTTSPESSGGTEHNWLFPYGTTVNVTAHPASGYVFESWSGEMTDTPAITAPVYPMTEHRLITAHFEKEVELETLEVRIEPVGAGYVTVSPAPEGGTQHNWLFPYGTTVYVTAHPNPGYVFDWWSGEMKDTPNITAPVYPMTEPRLITAHFIEEEVPGKEPPEVDTSSAVDITHDSARYRGRLVDTGYWNVVDCYFEWGKTTSYGKTTPKVRMYEGDEGEIFYVELLHQLEPDTTYHFRAVAITVGINGELKGYGPDNSFTTEKEVVKGFTMRVINARTGSVYWRAACVAGGGLPSTSSLKLNEVWEWTGAVPDYTLDFFVWSGDADKKTTQYDEFPFRLRVGKNYVWDFVAHEMQEA